MSKKLIQKLEIVLQDKKLTDENLVNEVHQLANSSDPKPRTILSRYSHFKKYIRENYPKVSNEVLKKMKAPDALIDSIIQDNNEVRSKKKSVSFDDDILKKLMELKSSKNIIDQLNFLTFTSGRRQSEVIDCVFHKVAKKPEMLSVKGLKKKRNENLDKPKAYKIQLYGINSTEWLKLHKSVIKVLEGVSVSDLNKRQNSRLKKTISKDYTVHTLRGIYAHALWLTNNDRSQNINGYITNVLNHDSSDTSLNYSYIIYNSKDDDKKEDKDVDKDIDKR